MPTITQRALSSGEVSPSEYARADLHRYQTGLAQLKNFTVRVEGGARNRPGMLFVGELWSGQSWKGRLIPFTFSTTQTYMLEFSTNGYMRVLKDGGYVAHPTKFATIQWISTSNPAIVQFAAHTFVTGDMVYITGLTGMTELNGRFHRVGATTATTIELVEEDSTTYSTYAGGGSQLAQSPYYIGAPWLAADLPLLNWTQSADVLTVHHPDYATRDITRTAHDAWTITTRSFSAALAAPTGLTLGSMPDSDCYVTGITKANPGVVTVLNNPFNDGDWYRFMGVQGMIEVNNIQYAVLNRTATTFELANAGGAIDTTGGGYTAYTQGGYGTLETLLKHYDYVVTAVDANGDESVESTNLGQTVRAMSTTRWNSISFNSVVGASYYKVYKSPAVSSGLYGLIGETESTTFYDYNFAPDMTQQPPTANDPISSVGTYPACGTYFAQRQVFAGGTNTPQDINMSKVSQFSNLDRSRPALSTDAIQVTLNSDQVNNILHLVPIKQNLVIFTTGAEWVLRSTSGGLISSGTIRADVETKWGSCEIRPVAIGSSIVFIEEDCSTVRDLTYNFEIDGYAGTEMSVTAKHLVKGDSEYSITAMAYQHNPDRILWLVRNDGVLLSLTYQREHEVWGWAQHDTDGIVEDVQVIRETPTHDAVYLIVQRNINGVDKRYVEKLADRNISDIQEGVFTDSAVLFNPGLPTKSVYGLNHLEGKTVTVLNNGNVETGKIVVNGKIELNEPTSRAWIGLEYLPTLKTLPIARADVNQLDSRGKNISGVDIRVNATRGLFVGPDEDRLDEVEPRYFTDEYGTPGFKSGVVHAHIDPDWEHDAQVVLRQAYPLACEILAITPTFDVDK